MVEVEAANDASTSRSAASQCWSAAPSWIAAGLPELIRPFADLIFQTLLHRPLHCSDVRHGQRMANKRLTETGTEENSADGPTVGAPP